jgi:hypothetical protein
MTFNIAYGGWLAGLTVIIILQAYSNNKVHRNVKSKYDNLLANVVKLARALDTAQWQVKKTEKDIERLRARVRTLEQLNVSKEQKPEREVRFDD